MFLGAIVFSVDAWDRWVKLYILSQRQNPQHARPGTEPSVRTSPGGRNHSAHLGNKYLLRENLQPGECSPGEVQKWITQKSFSVCFSWYLLSKLSKFHFLGLNNEAGNYCQKVNIFLYYAGEPLFTVPPALNIWLRIVSMWEIMNNGPLLQACQSLV